MSTVNLIYTVLLGGTASSFLTELFKLPSIPIAAKKYPRATAGILSFLSALVSFLVQGATFTTSNLAELAATAGGVFLVAVFTYTQALRGLKTNTEIEK